MSGNVTQILMNVTSAVMENVTLSTVTSYSSIANETASGLSSFSTLESSTLPTDPTETLPTQEDPSITFDSISFGYGVLVLVI
jgi:hypothetical protein